MKSFVKVLGLAAVSACFATGAMAGGFEFESKLGVFGKAAYADSAAFGGATYKGSACQGNGCGTFSGEQVSTETAIKKDWSTSKTTAYGSSGHQAGCIGSGSCEAQSHSGSVAGSLIGFGFGSKSGSFELDKKGGGCHHNCGNH